MSPRGSALEEPSAHFSRLGGAAARNQFATLLHPVPRMPWFVMNRLVAKAEGARGGSCPAPLP
eukprot:CAMPEP_0171660298 /NCGR_PEP_ID=MMETSP0990-20121206/44191_1 /TAXON_ID=483369 /ORGANISM="non described non described, Strain CCMP2098" /LENGTH=62 /DNA_ID=CAMNT_0012242131 /DNA_START=15 /DNA_END=199 /DNA_ORIENTATION=-